MSDSAHQGDAARLEAALERIVGALGRATHPPAAPSDAPPGNATPPDAHAAPDATPSPGATPAIDVAQLGARLDGLIAELRDVLGGDGGPPGDGLPPP